MKQNYLVLLLVFLCLNFAASAQVRRIGVLGSSTANGQGVPVDSGWTQKIHSYYRNNGLIDTLHRVAASTFDTYSGMPTGYVPPAGRNQPNTSYNITRLMSRIPTPTTVIINYPTTNFEVFSDQEILFCLDSIRKYANSFGAAVYIATTQPRDNFDDAGRARLKYLNGVIKNYFGDSAIDFFTTLYNPANNKIKPEFALGDGIHVNSRGQEALFRMVLQKNIFGIDTANVQRTLIDFGPATGPTAAPDYKGRYWNNVFDARQGVRLSNAVTTGNMPGTIGLEVINPLGSTAADNPAVGLSGTVGVVGDYPSSATNDHTIAIPSISNGRWRVYGLDPLKTYTVRFWGSMLLTGYRILQVKRSDETVWQEYNAGMSRNFNTAATFAFTGKSEMSFDFKVKSGSVAGHINVMDIVATVSNGPIPVNQLPVVDAGADITITAAEQATLAANATDPDGQIESMLWRKISGPAAFTISSTTITNPVISGLSEGAYQLEFSATDNRGAIVKDTIAVTVTAPVASATQRILIDLGLANGLTGSPDQWGKYWNNVADARRGIQLTNAKTTTNEATTLRFEVVNPAGATAAHDLNTRTSNTVGIVGDYPASATNDNAFAHTSITNGQWKISGLTPASNYNFKFWGSIPQSGNRIVQMRLAGSTDTTWKEFNSSQNFSSANAINLPVTGLPEAIFEIRVKSGSTFGYINVVDISVENKVVVLPVANAGRDTSITLPADSIRITGTNISDPQRSATNWRWRKISGPASFHISDSTVYNPVLANLVAGVYGLQLKVTDTASNSSFDTVYITVIPARVNKAPLAVAGRDTTIRLPFASLQLNGSGSSDTDGSIQAWRWLQLNGPSELTITSSTTVAPQLTGFVAGQYSIELLVTDNETVTGRDTLHITVQAAANQPPVANAGPDQSVTLPAAASLSGSGTDADGSIANYAWTKISGPSSFTISSPGSAATTVSNLAPGVYGFRLTVTDNLGLTDADTVYVTAIAATPTESQRILIDAGLAGSSTASPDSWGKYWNNVTDARAGVRVANAVNTANVATGISMQVVNATGSSAAYDLNTRTSNAVGVVGDYPATATNDNAFVHSSVTNGQWKFTGLQPTVSYVFKLWGSINTSSGNRIVQIKRNDETNWQEYNSTNNLNFSTAAVFGFTGKTEIIFDIRVKSGSSFGYINVIDITATSNAAATATPVAIKQVISKPDQPVELSASAFSMIAAPNPVLQKTTVRVNGTIRGNGSLSLANADGQVLLQTGIRKSTDLLTRNLYLTNLKPGVYFITLRIAHLTQTIRIVKN